MSVGSSRPVCQHLKRMLAKCWPRVHAPGRMFGGLEGSSLAKRSGRVAAVSCIPHHGWGGLGRGCTRRQELRRRAITHLLTGE